MHFLSGKKRKVEIERDENLVEEERFPRLGSAMEGGRKQKSHGGSTFSSWYKVLLSLPATLKTIFLS